MNTTLEQLETLFENGIISEAEYKMHKETYVLCKSTVMQIEKSTKKHYEALLHEKIANEESEKVRKYVKDNMRKRKIMDMFVNGILTEEDVKRLIYKE